MLEPAMEDYRLLISVPGHEGVRDLPRYTEEAARTEAMRVAANGPKPNTVRIQRGPDWTDVAVLRTEFHPLPR